MEESEGAFAAELLRTNDVAVISLIENLLTEAGIPHQVADRNMSVVEGGIGALQMRVLVPDDSAPQARRLLADGFSPIGFVPDGKPGRP